MKIIKLQAENVKKLVAVEIAPDGNIVQITGKNGAGKTSVLDSIYWALAGTKSHQSRPIRDGEEEAVIQLDMGDLKVKRFFKLVKPEKEGQDERLTTRIVVENTEGARFQSPQGMLDKLLDSLSFDPLAFMRKDGKKQAEILAKLCGIDLDASRKEYDAAYTKRRDSNREARDARTSAASIQVPEGTPDEPISVTELVAELETAQATNSDIDREAQNQDNQRAAAKLVRDRVARAEGQVKLLETELAAAKTTLAERTSAAEAAEQAVEELPELREKIDTEPIQQRIRDSESVNQNVSQKKRKAELEAKADAAETRSNELTATMEQTQKGVSDALAKADLPVKGLGIDDSEVTLDGLPLDQASSAKQMEVSTAIAMAGDHKLRVIRIENGSLMDSDALATLSRMATERDYQIWIERVDESGKIGFVIEDGTLKVSAEPPKESEPAKPETGLFPQG